MLLDELAEIPNFVHTEVEPGVTQVPKYSNIWPFYLSPHGNGEFLDLLQSERTAGNTHRDALH